MTLDDARRIFADNVDARGGSFLEWLHEQNRFDRDAFWRLYNAAVILAASEDASLQDTRDDALHVYQFVLSCFIWHHSPFHPEVIDELPKAELYLYIERLQFAFTTLIRGGRGYAWDAANDMANPRQGELDAYFAGEKGRG